MGPRTPSVRLVFGASPCAPILTHPRLWLWYRPGMSGKLEQTLAEADPERRIKALQEYIERGEASLTKARSERIATIRELRKVGATWPHIRDLTGLSEQWMRKEIAK